MEPLFSFVIAISNDVDGSMDIQIYDDCESASDALVTYAEDEGYANIPDVVGLKDEDATAIMIDWFANQDIGIAVKQL